jgi:PXPV repeat (3 copies)
MRSPTTKESTMNRTSRAKTFLAAAVVLGGLAAASAAHARSDVQFSIGIHAPIGYGYGYAQPAPVYVQPQPVYVQPQPVYVQPQPVYVERRHGHRWHESRRWRDADRDGVPNRFDRAPHNPYYR